MKRFLLTALAVFNLTLASGQTDTLLLRQLQEMSRQMSAMQLQLQEIQQETKKYNKPKDLIPANKKNTSRFYWSLQFGFLLTDQQYYYSEGSKEPLGTKFSYALKPAFGYIFNPRLSAGCTIVFADCQFSGLTSYSFKYMIANALIGGGIMLSDYINWKIQPYVRYRFTKVFWERVNLWGEFSFYGGQMIPRNTATRQLEPWNSSGQIGINIRPMITINLNQNLMLFSTMELLSWNATWKQNNGATVMNNSVIFEFIPIYSILTGLVNIGIIKRF